MEHNVQLFKVKKKKYKMKFLPQENEIPELEIKKMRQGMSYSCKEKTIILNVFKYFRNQFTDKCVTDIVRRTAKATGCSEKSIFQFRKEESSEEGFKEPSKTKVRKNININSRDIKYDNVVRDNIRNIIYDLQFKNIPPSLNTILKQITTNKLMPKFSVMTLRRLMYDMGFSYQKNGNKFVLVEQAENRLINPNNINEEINNVNHFSSQQHIQQQEQVMKQSLPPPPPIPQQPQMLSHQNHLQHHILPQHQLKPPPPSVIPNLPPDHSMSSHMHKTAHNMHLSSSLIPLLPQNEGQIMPPPPPEIMHHSHMLQKTMPQMMMNHRRDQMHPVPPVSLPVSVDMHHRKRDHIPWMHGVIKQGQ